jgi:hypothetical protein
MSLEEQSTAAMAYKSPPNDFAGFPVESVHFPWISTSKTSPGSR